VPALAVQAATAPLFISLAHGRSSLIVVGLLTLASAALGSAAFVLLGLGGQRRRELLQVLGEALGTRAPATSA
jgi:hypothetical protein